MNQDQHFVLILITIFGVVLPAILAVGIPLGKAWARRLEDRGRQVEQEDTVAKLGELRTRVAELEERLDFTERVLAGQREAHQLGDGQG